LIFRFQNRPQLNSCFFITGVVLAVVSFILALNVPSDAHWRWLKFVGVGYFWGVITVILLEVVYALCDNFFLGKISIFDLLILLICFGYVPLTIFLMSYMGMGPNDFSYLFTSFFVAGFFARHIIIRFNNFKDA
jgi:hypothetical protein